MGFPERMEEGEKFKGFKRSHSLRMDKIKRTFSFRKKKDHVPESSKPHQWQEDEKKVREGSCSFQVRYLGCVEVYESRGMQVCEEAVKALKQNKAKHQRAVLYVSGDALRVVDEIRKGLIVDQTIEKVSFCAPDRGHEKGFAYICRDGTTRRWMCHGFMAVKESVSGERLSHAVGCAFAICLERKQKRDKDSGVTITFNEDKTSFTRTGSFRQTTITERLQDPQSAIIAEPVPTVNVNMNAAIERPHATENMLQKMGSFRGFPKLHGVSSPFKRQMSLPVRGQKAELAFDLEGMRAAQNGAGASPIHEEMSPSKDNMDSIAEMCQQLSAGLSELSTSDRQQHSALVHHNQAPPTTAAAAASASSQHNWPPHHQQNNSSQFQATFPASSSGIARHPPVPVRQINPWGSPEKHQPPPPPAAVHQPVVAASGAAPAPGASFWLNSSSRPAPSVPASSDRLYTNTFDAFGHQAPPVRAPHLNPGLRSHSIDSGEIMTNNAQPASGALRAPTLKEMSVTHRNWQSVSTSQTPVDPFDVAWAERAAVQASAPGPASTNPFATGNTVKAFEVKL